MDKCIRGILKYQLADWKNTKERMIWDQPYARILPQESLVCMIRELREIWIWNWLKSLFLGMQAPIEVRWSTIINKIFAFLTNKVPFFSYRSNVLLFWPTLIESMLSLSKIKLFVTMNQSRRFRIKWSQGNKVKSIVKLCRPLSNAMIWNSQEACRSRKQIMTVLIYHVTNSTYYESLHGVT